MNDELLIALVEKCPHLYDRCSKDYKDETLKNNSWSSIAQYLESDVAAVKKRWENMRDRFVRAYREYNTKAPSGSAGGPKKEIDFIYFNIMLWLGPYIRKRKLTSSIAESPLVKRKAPSTNSSCSFIPVGETSGTQMVFADNTELDISEDIEETVKTETGDQEEIIIEYDPPEEVPPRSLHSSQSTPKQSTSKRNVMDVMSVAAANFSKLCETQLQQKESQSSSGDINFMKSVVEDMKSLTPRNKLKFKKEVMELLCKYMDE
ncbi:uncharacterized protein LOC126882947 [Diabrotica virgifera virgifera]|uniref:Transcription factor Adf-1-like n=1 Tax=Diabrotica virgifera virgifera TaxID=50390 RepID=A0ABM5K1B9_DIAVI|nr:uncharacterized protein LOC126882947 [Diabrotica virgifera virgifera]